MPKTCRRNGRLEYLQGRNSKTKNSIRAEAFKLEDTFSIFIWQQGELTRTIQYARKWTNGLYFIFASTTSIVNLILASLFPGIICTLVRIVLWATNESNGGQTLERRACRGEASMCTGLIVDATEAKIWHWERNARDHSNHSRPLMVPSPFPYAH